MESHQYRPPEDIKETMRELVREFAVDSEWEVKPTNEVNGEQLARQPSEFEAYAEITSRSEGFLLQLKEFQVLETEDHKKIIAQAAVYNRNYEKVEEAVVRLKDGKLRLYRDTNFEEFFEHEQNKKRAIVSGSILAGAATAGTAIYLISKRRR